MQYEPCAQLRVDLYNGCNDNMRIAFQAFPWNYSQSWFHRTSYMKEHPLVESPHVFCCTWELVYVRFYNWKCYIRLDSELRYSC